MSQPSSAFDLGKFTSLCTRLAKIDLFGTAPPLPPWGAGPASAAAVARAVGSGADALPLTYRTSYVQPLLASAPALVRRNRGAVEPFVAPIYEHAANSTVQPQLARFLAVISNLYRSFLDSSKRAKLDIRLSEQLPPLAFFQHDGESGPYTIPANDIAREFATDIGVVSLPSTYRDHPLLWLSLAHETGGHDVVHADAGLIDELQRGVDDVVGGSHAPASGSLSARQLQGLLWAYWMDETVADVYGLLNIGPQFALNLAAFFSAMNAVAAKQFQGTTVTLPILRTSSGADQSGALDEHPTDILRLDVAIGAIGALTSLSDARKQTAIATLRALSTACAQGAKLVTLDGLLPVGQHTGVPLDSLQLPLDAMQETARAVGAFVATKAFDALAGHSVQAIETWDDLDEDAAQRIAARLLAGHSIVDLGDDAQLLAGANAALVANPALYDAVTASLNDALDSSFAHDPIWATPTGHGLRWRGRLAKPVALARPRARRVAKPRRR